MSDSDAEHGAPSSLDAMVKKMVRLALASEYSRLPIRRTDISAKVLGEQGSRQFKTVFEAAQQSLRSKFGMEMVELPAREKVTITQRRAAQKTEKPSSSTKSWILTTILPATYRTPAIIPPTRAPSTNTESTYTALYSFIIAVISLNGGSLAEQKLTRYLRRMNADDYTPVDRTDKLLARLCREGYIVRTKESDNGEEIIEFMVGPRGKIEVGSSGVAGLVREVYGRGPGAGAENGDDGSTELDREGRAEFEARLRQSLGIVGVREQDEEEEGREQQQAVNGRGAGEAGRSARPSEVPRRSSRRATTAHESSSGESETEDSVKDESEEESD
ncbi:Non-structural maintenance of chromosome element 3 [Penicillium subrubescens]|uniref:Non-structural maintenance of chromosome element 3 n=2 Tax=Penicillium subrubescens TaxID=1316194 RepID=A0A1Q5T0Y3_9EURO|nr:Non-structural maintenance of chromosome element 3 [Penicillium subrubescens]